MLKTLRFHFVIIGLILSLLLAACGGGDDETAAPESGAVSESAAEPEAAASEEEGEEDAGDLAEKHEFGLTEEEMLDAIDQVEQLVAQCMKDAGFEYVAVDANTVRESMSADKALPGMSEEEFYSQYGLGISTLYTGQAPQLADVSTPASMGLGEQNIGIFQNLSPTDQVAYNQTLFGEHVDAPLAVALEREDFSRSGGCTLTAVQQVFPADNLEVTYVNPKDFAIDNDPRVQEALSKYAACMQEAGFDIGAPEDIRPLITESLDEITGGAPVDALSADAKAALTELQQLEISMAGKSFECESTHLEPVKQQVEDEL
ncbi:MAG: hypothetical protein R3A44_31930 [Caldilineaceae bacterium]